MSTTFKRSMKVLGLALIVVMSLSRGAFAAGYSDFMEEKIQEWVFKQEVTGTPPSVLAIGLHASDPGDTCANELVSGSSPSYARASKNPDTDDTTNTNWNAQDQVSGARRETNLTAVTFPTATGNWNSSNPIQWWSLWDATTSGNCLLSGSVTGGGVVILNGNTLTFTGGTPGQLSFTVD